MVRWECIPKRVKCSYIQRRVVSNEQQKKSSRGILTRSCIGDLISQRTIIGPALEEHRARHGLPKGPYLITARTCQRGSSGAGSSATSP